MLIISPLPALDWKKGNEEGSTTHRRLRLSFGKLCRMRGQKLPPTLPGPGGLHAA